MHHSTTLVAADVTRFDRIPVTTVTRTLIDIAGVVRADIVEEALDDALRGGLVTLGRLRQRLEQIGRRRGSRMLGDLIAARDGTPGVPQSVFETRLLGVIRQAGLPMPALQYPVAIPNGIAVVDFAFVEYRIAVEADGFRWHSGRRRWDHDRARRNALTLLGWIVIHVTWRQLRDRPREIVEAVRTAISLRQAAGVTPSAYRPAASAPYMRLDP